MKKHNFFIQQTAAAYTFKGVSKTFKMCSLLIDAHLMTNETTVTLRLNCKTNPQKESSQMKPKQALNVIK